jgi:outer membrane protein insertion porin family
VFPDVVAMAKLEGGHVAGFGDDGLRTTDTFFKGGETVRGFKTAGFGPRDLTGVTGNQATNPAFGLVRPDALGGTVYAAGTAELQFPIFFLPQELGFRGAVFADAGTLFDPADVPQCFNYGTVRAAACGTPGAVPTVIADDSSIRSSVGASLLWNSPFGPLRADFAYVIGKEEYDRTQWFRFGGGASF